MKDEERLIEVMAELLAEVHEMRMDVNKRLESLEKQQKKTNVGISELRLSVMKLGDREHVVDDHEKRIRKIEQKVF